LIAHSPFNSLKRFYRNRRGYSGIIAAIFLVLIVLFLVFNVFMYMQNRNTDFQNSVSQAQQLALDRDTEQLTISNISYAPDQSQNIVNVKCAVENTGSLAVQIIRLWLSESPGNVVGNITMNIPLQPGGIQSWSTTSIPVKMQVTSADAQFDLHFVTSRGNTFSGNPLLSSPSNTASSNSFVGSTLISNQAPNPINQGDSTNYTVTVQRGLLQGGFSAVLSAFSLPSGASASFNPSTVAFAQNQNISLSTLTLTTNAATPIGSSTFSVTATNMNDPTDHATGYNSLNVASTGRLSQVSISLQNPNPVNQRDSTNYTITLTRGTSQSDFYASLSISQLPSGVTVSINPTTLHFSTGDLQKTAQLVLTTNTQTPMGSSIFTIKASVQNSNEEVTGYGSLNVIEQVAQEFGSIRMDWTSFQFYDFGNSVPSNGAHLPLVQYGMQLPASHYLVIAAYFTNLDPAGRTVTLTPDTCVWAVDPRTGTQGGLKTLLVWNIANVDSSGNYHTSFTSQELEYNVPTLVYFYSSSQTPSSSLAPTAIPLNIIFYGTTSTGDYGQNNPFVSVKFVDPIPVTITSTKTGSNFVLVDGTDVTTPHTFYWESNTVHTLTAQSPVLGTTGTRYIYNNWAAPSIGTVSSQTFVYAVPSSAETLTANYKTQYYLTVDNGGMGSTSGQGWYDQGTQASFNINPTLITGTPPYAFTRWVGAGVGSYTGFASTNTVTMNNPVNETANWVQQTQITAQYTTQDGSTPQANVVLSGTQAGQPFTLVLTRSAQTVFLDTSTAWSVNTQIPASPSSERWIANQGTIGTVSSSTAVNPLYYHQNNMTLSCTIVAGGSPSAPTLTASQFGEAYTPTITNTAATYWCDTGSAWSITNPLSTSGSSERWQTVQAVTGTVTTQSLTFRYYHQYLLTLSYNVMGDGAYSPPVFSSTQFGSPYTLTLTASPIGYWIDNTAAWSITNPLTGSGSSERWQTSQTTQGSMNSAQTLGFSYNHQFIVTFGYSDQDHSSIASGIQIGSYYQFGSSGGSIRAGSSYGTTSPAQDWVDAGSAKVTYVSGVSGTQRWSLSGSSDSKDVSSSTSVLESGYFHQYQVTLQYSIANSAGSSYSDPTVTFSQFGVAATDIAKQASAPRDWIDAGSTVTYTNPLTGSGSTERWLVSGADSPAVVDASVSQSETLNPRYYHQFSTTLSYSIVGDGTPTAPLFTANQFGAPITQTLTITSSPYWFDAGASWTATNPLGTSSSANRWQTPSAAGTLSAAAPTTLSLPYYHQYLATLSFSVSGGGSGYSAPVFTASMYGATFGQTLTTTASGYWFDSDAAWTVTNPLVGSGATERWQTNQPTSDTVSISTIKFTYYHQYLITLSYTVNGGGSGYSAPTFTANQFGSAASQTLAASPTGYWFDAGASWTATNSLGGSTSTERWQASTQSGTVSAASTLTIAYAHQYYVNFAVNPSGWGTTLPTSGWQDAGATINISASKINGYKFSSWSASGLITVANVNSASTTATISGTGTITANFT
jgi:hypothetical protein